MITAGRENMIRFISKHKIAFSVLLVTVLMMVVEISRFLHVEEWKKYQKSYYKILKSKVTTIEEKSFLGSQKPRIISLKVEHGFNNELCITCHIGYDDKRLTGNTVPVSFHQGAKEHSFLEFGCVECHEGFGGSLEKMKAHAGIEGRIAGLIPPEFYTSVCIRCHDLSDLSENISERIMAGKKNIEELYCSDCHIYENSGNASGFDLEVLKNHRFFSIEKIKSHFESTREVLNSSIREKNMQNKKDGIDEVEDEIVQLSKKELDSLLYLLIGIYNNPKDSFLTRNKSFPDISKGEKLVGEYECFECHSLNGKGGDIAPDLLNVTYRRSRAWIRQHLIDPAIINKNSEMTKLGLSGDDINEIYKYLSTLKDALAAFSRKKFLTPAERGRNIFLKYNCAVCHGVNGEGGVLNPNSIAKYISPLLFVKEGYSKDEMKKFILNGNRDITKLKPDGPDPYFFMPAFKNIISNEEVSYLVEYLISLYPKKSESDEDDW